MYEAHIFLDFEMNPIPRQFHKEQEPCRAELCEIGAVKLDAAYQPVARYSRFVKPHYGQIAPHITRLTGIRNEDVAGAPEFASAITDFAAWIGDRPARIYSWSLSDWHQINKERHLKAFPLPWQLTQRWMDFQAVYTRLIGLSGAHPLSLKCAVGAVDQTFDGSAHRAVDDAANAAELLRMVKTGQWEAHARIIRETLRPSDSFSVGDALKHQLATWRSQQKP